MTEKQLSQKEKDLLVTHYLNKMSQYLRPFPISLGKFFKGEVSIDSALPFRNVLNLGVEVSDITQRIFPFSNKHLENLQSSGLNATIYYFESIIPTIKIDGKPLQEIIDETGYQLKLVEDPVARVVSSNLFNKLAVERSFLEDIIEGKQEQDFRTLPFSCTCLDFALTRKKLALTTGNGSFKKWVIRKGVKLFGIDVKKELSYTFYAHELAGLKDAKWFEWVKEFEDILLPCILNELSFAFLQMYKKSTPLTSEDLLELTNKENTPLLED